MEIMHKYGVMFKYSMISINSIPINCGVKILVRGDITFSFLRREKNINYILVAIYSVVCSAQCHNSRVN